MNHESTSPIAPLVDDEGALRGEFRRRNSIWESVAVTPKEVQDLELQGWVKHRELKTRVRMQRARQPQERLANKWWVLLYRMGYLEMNGSGTFRVLGKRRAGVVPSHEFDVFARDEETLIVSICEAHEAIRAVKMVERLNEFEAAKSDVAAAVRSFYGQEYKPKILWFFVTENIIWSTADRALASRHNIKVVTELELPYFTQLVDHLGHAARYQFLAEYLKDQKVPELDDVRVPATRGRLGGETFFSFVATPRQLLKIAFVNHRTLADPEGYPTYQRLIQKPRLKQIGKFIEDGGYFPNNLLINFPKSPRFDVIQKDASGDVHHGILFLPNTYKSAWIIDGQHRLYGYANLPKRFLDQKLMVLAFEKMKPADEAMLFVTINHEQKPVPKNLLDDLEGQLGWESDVPSERIGAIASRVIHQLGIEMGGPLYNRIVAEGIKGTDKTCLTVPSLKSGLKRSGVLGRVVDGEYQKGALCAGSDNATVVRAMRVLNGYFLQLMNADIQRWDSGRKGRVCNNEGVQALMLLFGEVVAYKWGRSQEALQRLSELEIVEAVAEIIEPVVSFIRAGGATVDKEFTVPFGSGGPKEYLFRLARLIRSKFKDFSPQEYASWEAAQSEEDRVLADRRIQEINIAVQRHIFRVFRELYGEEDDRYWEKGVPSSEMRTKAYGKAAEYDVDERGPLESYLDFIDYKKIVEKPDRWQIFKGVFHIPLDGEKGIAKATSWMDRINELRRISAHAGDGRKYKVSDFPLIEKIHAAVMSGIREYDYSGLIKQP